MRAERLLRSRCYRAAVVTDAFETLEIAPDGDLREVRGIQVAFVQYPRAGAAPRQTVMLPPDDAFEIAREIIRVHRGQTEPVAVAGLVADHVGFHAMSESEALMIEAVMQWEGAEMRVAFWQSLRDPRVAQRALAHFVKHVDDPSMFQKLAAIELAWVREET